MSVQGLYLKPLQKTTVVDSTSLMRVMLKKRLLKLCCYVLTASISLSPVVHASYMALLDADSDHIIQEVQAGHTHTHSAEGSVNCHHQEFDVADAMESCDHDSGMSCKMLCTVSISIVPTESVGGMPSNRPDKWLVESASQRIQSIPLSLFKPPRS